MNSLLFATANPGKVQEARLVFGRAGFPVAAPFEITELNFAALGLRAFPGVPPEIEETADTYLGNARLKADGCFRWCGLPSVADDSGLEVDSLGGAPGLRSARFAGFHGSAQANIDKLLALLVEEQNRSARFRSLIFCRIAPEAILTAEGVLEGGIARVQKGTGGFGYDSVFAVKGFGGRTLAELKDQGVEVKTHRILALEELCRRLKAAPLGPS